MGGVHDEPDAYLALLEEEVKDVDRLVIVPVSASCWHLSTGNLHGKWREKRLFEGFFNPSDCAHPGHVDFLAPGERRRDVTMKASERKAFPITYYPLSGVKFGRRNLQRGYAERSRLQR